MKTSFFIGEIHVLDGGDALGKEGGQSGKINMDREREF